MPVQIFSRPGQIVRRFCHTGSDRGPVPSGPPDRTSDKCSLRGAQFTMARADRPSVARQGHNAGETPRDRPDPCGPGCDRARGFKSARNAWRATRTGACRAWFGPLRAWSARQVQGLPRQSATVLVPTCSSPSSARAGLSRPMRAAGSPSMRWGGSPVCEAPEAPAGRCARLAARPSRGPGKARIRDAEPSGTVGRGPPGRCRAPAFGRSGDVAVRRWHAVVRRSAWITQMAVGSKRGGRRASRSSRGLSGARAGAQKPGWATIWLFAVSRVGARSIWRRNRLPSPGSSGGSHRLPFRAGIW